MSGRLLKRLWRKRTERPNRSGKKGSWLRGVRIGGLALLVIAALAALGALGWRVAVWVQQSPSFVLRHIEISGHETLCVDEIRSLYPLPEGTDLLDVDIRAMGAALEVHPRILRAIVQRRFPDRLAVRVIERVAVAQVPANGWHEIDDEGVVLGPVRAEWEDHLPRFAGVKMEEPVVPGSVLRDPVTARLMEVVRALGRPPFEDWGPGRRMSMFLVSGDGSLTIPMSSSSSTVLLGREDWIERLWKLPVVQSQWEDSGSELGLIDLRFENLVIVGPMPESGRELAQGFSGV
jgi:cell division septal protein FtsQ